MGRDRVQFVQKTDVATGALSFTIEKVNQIYNILVNIDALPTTSENLTIKVNANSGTTHLLYSVDPSLSTGSTWDLFWDPEPSLGLAEGDTVVVEYANTDANTVALVANCVPF